MLALLSLLVIGAGCKTLVPTERYETRTLAGFTVRINRALPGDEVGKQALSVLEARLLEVTILVAPPQLAKLREVPIWIGVDDGTHPEAEYHKSQEWLREHGCNPDKAKAVEIGNARHFVEVRRSQPMALLHELAHAYHDRVLHDDPRITRLYESALASKRYDAVLRNSGVTARHYALTDAAEYFAEGTEAFFGENDFYPFVSAELRTHDPALYAFLEEVWGPVDPRACTLRVENGTERKLTLYWKSPTGELKAYATIEPGKVYTQQTFVGHQWIAKDGEQTIAERTASGDAAWRITR